MVFTKKHKAFFIVREGESRGKKISIKGSRSTIGTSKKCDIRLQGDYVSELHAVIERKGNGWVINNNSPSGTYLNEHKVETESLGDGAVLQIGSANTLVFHTGVPAVESEKDVEQTGLEGEKKTNWTLVGGGIALFYIPILYFGYLYFFTEGGITNTARKYTAVQLEESVEESRIYLENMDSSATASYARIGDTDLYALLQQTSDQAKRNVLIETLTAEAKEHLLEGYWLSKSGRYKSAVSEYQKAISLVPDPRNPTTEFALGAIGTINRLTSKPKKSSGF